MNKLFQYKSKDPNGSYAWLHTELFGSLEELKAQHPLDPEPEWREVVIVPIDDLFSISHAANRATYELGRIMELVWDYES